MNFVCAIDNGYHMAIFPRLSRQMSWLEPFPLTLHEFKVSDGGLECRNGTISLTESCETCQYIHIIMLP